MTEMLCGRIRRSIARTLRCKFLRRPGGGPVSSAATTRAHRVRQIHRRVTRCIAATVGALAVCPTTRCAGLICHFDTGNCALGIVGKPRKGHGSPTGDTASGGRALRVGLCHQYWYDSRVLPGIVTQIVNTSGKRSSTPSGISAPCVSYCDILRLLLKYGSYLSIGSGVGPRGRRYVT